MMTISSKAQVAWQAACVELAQEIPHYARAGKPNMIQLAKAASACADEEPSLLGETRVVTLDNLPAMAAAIQARYERKSIEDPGKYPPLNPEDGFAEAVENLPDPEPPEAVGLGPAEGNANSSDWQPTALPLPKDTGAMLPAVIAPANLGLDLMTLGKILGQCGYFQDVKSISQAVVKVLAGRELGLGPIASMTGLYIVKGRVTMSANLMAALVKRGGRYSYRVVEHSITTCEIAFTDGGTEIGRSRFTMDDAQRAGLAEGDNWRKYPANMLFARAMSNGVKWYCPDIGSGPLYTPDELADS